jgi:hypothetical protein
MCIASLTAHGLNSQLEFYSFHSPPVLSPIFISLCFTGSFVEDQFAVTKSSQSNGIVRTMTHVIVL